MSHSEDQLNAFDFAHFSDQFLGDAPSTLTVNYFFNYLQSM